MKIYKVPLLWPVVKSKKQADLLSCFSRLGKVNFPKQSSCKNGQCTRSQNKGKTSLYSFKIESIQIESIQKYTQKYSKIQ